MATSKKSESETTKVQHLNGVTVVVSAEKAERLVAGGQFTKASAAKSSADSSK